MNGLRRLRWLAGLTAVSQLLGWNAAAQLTVPEVLLRKLRSENPRSEPTKRPPIIIDGFPALETARAGTFLMMKLETLNKKSALHPAYPSILEFAMPYADYINLDPAIRLTADLQSLCIPLPDPLIDHKNAQTSIKNQGDRPTCVAHATLAAIEAHVGNGNLDLSEDFAHHALLAKLGSQCCRQPDPTDSAKTVDPHTIDAAGHLKDLELPTENVAPWKYNFQWPMCVIQDTCYTPRHNAQPVSPPTYKLTTFDVISQATVLSGPSIRNTAYLEVILASGFDVVIAMGVAWPTGAEGGVIDVIMEYGAPRIEEGGHAMLLTGYDRNAGYFIAKNSMGDRWGHNGYAWLSYKYLTTYARYGFIVRSVT